MASLPFDGLILIILTVFLGWCASVYLFDRRLQSGGPVVYGTRIRLRLTKLAIWASAFGASLTTMIVVSSLLPGITVVAILFGVQAMLFDYCSRIRYLPASIP